MLTKRQILAVFVASRLGVFLVAGLSQHLLPKGPWYGPAPDSVWDARLAFFRWDAHWYYGIAQSGYFYTPGEESSVAFLPGYPLAVRAADLLLKDAIWGGLLVSNISLLVGAFALQRLVLRETENQQAADTSVLFLLLCPVGVFFSILYSEALFFLFTVLAVDEIRSGRFGRGAFFSGLASATKPLGILLLIPLALEVNATIRARKASPAAWLWLVIASSGLAAYCVYLQQAFGDPFAFVAAQGAWGREAMPPWEALRELKTRSFPEQAMVIATIGAVTTLLSELARSSIWRGYVVYGVVFFVAIISTRVLITLPRHASAIFPVYIALALTTADRPAVRRVLLAGSSLLLALSTALFVNGYRLL